MSKVRLYILVGVLAILFINRKSLEKISHDYWLQRASKSIPPAEIVKSIQDAPLTELKDMFEFYKCDPNLVVDGKSLIFYAVEKNRPDVVKLLIDTGANINKPGPNNSLPLDAATVLQRTEIIALLKEKGGMSFDRPGNSYPVSQDELVNRFIAASNQGQEDEAIKLLDQGLNPSATKPGSNPQIGNIPLLFFALRNHQRRLTEVLLSKGVSPNTQIGFLKSSPLLICIDDDDRETFSIMVNHGADVNMKDAMGSTPLDHAYSTTLDRTYIIEELKRAGAVRSSKP